MDQKPQIAWNAGSEIELQMLQLCFGGGKCAFSGIDLAFRDASVLPRKSRLHMTGS